MCTTDGFVLIVEKLPSIATCKYVKYYLIRIRYFLPVFIEFWVIIFTRSTFINIVLQERSESRELSRAQKNEIFTKSGAGARAIFKWLERALSLKSDYIQKRKWKRSVKMNLKLAPLRTFFLHCICRITLFWFTSQMSLKIVQTT